MHIYVSIDFTGGSWPGPLSAELAAHGGEVWTDPIGLLSLLETALGLTAPWPSEAERLGGFMAILASRLGGGAAAAEGVGAAAPAPFWAASAQADLMGTARALLQLRDALRLSGWQGEDFGLPRLQELADITQSVLPGLPERLEKVLQRLQQWNCWQPPVDRIFLLEPPALYPRLWQDTFGVLRERNIEVSVEERSPAAAQANSNLAAYQQVLSSAEGSVSRIDKNDGTLQLLRAAGPALAAEHVAAWLKAIPEHERRRVVIINPEPVLDDALRRFGLPTSGAAGQTTDNVLLHILPLVLELCWEPPDPQRVLELLMLPVSPIPLWLRRKLIMALQEWPAVGSPRWQSEYEQWQQEFAENYPSSAEAVFARLNRLFAGMRASRQEGISVEILLPYIQTLRQWIYGRLSAPEQAAASAESLENEDAGEASNQATPENAPATKAAWEAALAQLEAFDRLVALAQTSPISPPLLEKFLQQATGEVLRPQIWPAEAGLWAVERPGAVAGPADIIIWWNFTRAAAEALETIALTPRERACLAEQGIILPEVSLAAQSLGQRWRRPLEQATQALLLVCPYYDSQGEPAYPHPLWDELEGKTQPPQLLQRLIVSKPAPLQDCAPACSSRPALPVPRAQAQYTVPGGLIQPRAEESASGLECLISCPLRWVLQNAAKIWPAPSCRLSAGERLVGELVHYIIAQLLAEIQQGEAISGEQAYGRALALFDALAPQLAAPLFMPGNDSLRARARWHAAASAQALVNWLQQNQLALVALETEQTAAFGEIQLKGRPDLIVQGPQIGQGIVDLKWAGASYQRDNLRNGAAVQLACYSHLVPQAPPEKWGLIFILSQQRFLGLQAQPYPSLGGVVSLFAGPALQKTFQYAVQAYLAAREAVQAGQIQAPGVSASPPKSRLTEEEGLTLAPACGFCDYGSLCGKNFGGANNEQ